MKFKYFLRGLGTGIIFATLVCFVAFNTSGSKEISDKEVIERARKLGMVEEKSSVKDLFVSDKIQSSKESEDESDKKDKDSAKEKKTEDSSSEKKKNDKKTTEEEKITQTKTTEVTTEQTTTEQTTEGKTTEQKTEASTEATTEKQEESAKEVTITIKGGMSSYPVCQMLQEIGVIKDAMDFDNYLIKNGYASRISVGTHTLKIGMSYEEIAIAISDPR